jgi:hypothetical protein
MGLVTRILGLGFPVLLGLAAPAAAKDLCIQGSFAESYVFKKVPKLKLGRAVPLVGVQLFGGEQIPVMGMAAQTTATNIEMMVWVGGMRYAGGTGTNSLYTMQLDLAFTGDGQVDGDANFVADAAVPHWTGVDCSTL